MHSRGGNKIRGIIIIVFSFLLMETLSGCFIFEHKRWKANRHRKAQYSPKKYIIYNEPKVNIDNNIAHK